MRPARCSICDEKGHYARTCPIPQAGDESPEHAKAMPHGPLYRCHLGCGALLWDRDKPTHECRHAHAEPRRVRDPLDP